MQYTTRRRTSLTIGSLTLVSMMYLVQLAYPCRIIVPPYPWPPPVPIPRPAPVVRPVQVKEHKAVITIDGNHAQVAVDATFYNPNAQRIEGTYIFPVPRQAAVSSFAMTVNGKTLEAELLEADKAREIYEQIVRNLKDPALLEYLDQGLLRARVFPIEPHTDVQVHLTYDQIVTRDAAVQRFAYPLLSAKPDGDQSIQSLHLEVTIRADESLKTVFSPGFDTVITRPDARTAKTILDKSNYTPHQDFEVVYGTDAGDIGVDVMTYREGEQGFFLMMIAPDSELQAEEIAAKDLTLVLDTSGSMMGEKLRQAKKALQFCVENLNRNDTFNIMAFATDVRPFAEQPVPATDEQRQRAIAFINDLKPRGGTAIAKVLDAVLQQSVAREHVGFVVFLTDGLPTIGEVAPKKLLQKLNERSRRRFYTFGVGNDVNTHLLDGLAARTGGYSTYVRPEEDLELALSSFFEKIAYPVMTDLKLDTGTAKFYEMNPPELPSIFKGSQVAVTGKFEGKGTLPMKLSGVVGNDREVVAFDAVLESDPRNAFIPRAWAVNRVGYLQDQIRLNGRNDELVNEIKRLGRKYGILTPYTSFLVVEEGMERHRLEEAREAFGALEHDATAADTGAVAVEHARRSQAMKAGRGAPAAAESTPSYSFETPMARAGLKDKNAGDFVQHAHDKTFFYRRADQYWYDSEIPRGETPTPAIEVAAWSDEFFELLDTYPDLRRYIKAGARLVVQIDGVIIRITE